MIDIHLNRTRNQPDWKGSNFQDAALLIKMVRSYVEPLWIAFRDVYLQSTQKSRVRFVANVIER